MQNIAVSDLRANMMKIIKKIESGATLNITSRGKVVAKLVPPDNIRKSARNILNRIRKTAVIHDVVSPVDVEWKEMQE